MGMPGPSTNNANRHCGKNSFFQSLMSVKYLYGKGTVPLHYSILSGDKNGYVAVNENVLPMGYATSGFVIQTAISRPEISLFHGSCI